MTTTKTSFWLQTDEKRLAELLEFADRTREVNPNMRHDIEMCWIKPCFAMSNFIRARMEEMDVEKGVTA